MALNNGRKMAARQRNGGEKYQRRNGGAQSKAASAAAAWRHRRRGGVINAQAQSSLASKIENGMIVKWHREMKLMEAAYRKAAMKKTYLSKFAAKRQAAGEEGEAMRNQCGGGE